MYMYMYTHTHTHIYIYILFWFTVSSITFTISCLPYLGADTWELWVAGYGSSHVSTATGDCPSQGVLTHRNPSNWQPTRHTDTTGDHTDTTGDHTDTCRWPHRHLQVTTQTPAGDHTYPYWWSHRHLQMITDICRWSQTPTGDHRQIQVITQTHTSDHTTDECDFYYIKLLLLASICSNMFHLLGDITKAIYFPCDTWWWQVTVTYRTCLES